MHDNLGKASCLRLPDQKIKMLPVEITFWLQGGVLPAYFFFLCSLKLVKTCLRGTWELVWAANPLLQMWAISKSSSAIPHDTCQMIIWKSWGGIVFMRGSLLGQKELRRTQLCYLPAGWLWAYFFNFLGLYLPYLSPTANITFLIGLWGLKQNTEKYIFRVTGT